MGALGALIGAFFATDRPAIEPPPALAQEDPPSRVECLPCNGEGYICGKRCGNCKGYGTVKRHDADLTLYPEKETEPDCQVKILSSLPRR